MSDFVWVKLDRDEADAVERYMLPTGCGCSECEVRRSIVTKIRAALSEPSENQVEKVARAIAAADGFNFDDALRYEVWDEWVERTRAMAEAALAVLFGGQEKEQKASEPGLPTGQFFSGQNEINRLKTNAEYWRRRYMQLAGSLEND